MIEMRKQNYIIVGAIILFMFSCTNSGNKIESTKVISVDDKWWESNSDLVIRNINSKTVFSDLYQNKDFLPGPILTVNDSIILTDLSNHEVFYSNDYSHFRKICVFGDGVDEIRYILDLGRMKNGFFVYGYASNSQKIIYYDIYGNFNKSMPLENVYHDIAYNDDSCIAIKRQRISQDHIEDNFKHLMFYDHELENSDIIGQALANLYRSYGILVDFTSIPFHIEAFNDEILVLSNCSKYIYCFDHNGLIIDIVELDDPKTQWKPTTASKGDPIKGVFSSIAIDEINKIIFLGGGNLPWKVGFKEDRKHYIYVLNEKKELLNIMIIDNFPSFITCYNNELYVSDSEVNMNIIVYDYTLVLANNNLVD